MENYSNQREEMIGIIKKLYSHPTAEEIYFLTKQKDPAVSRSTVYRNLSFLVKKGLVTQIAVSNGPDRYDYIADRPKHGHIICTKCGEMYDFMYDFDTIKETIWRQTGVEMYYDGIVITGICHSCKEAQN